MNQSQASGQGWYPDPSGAHHLRYYDGMTWTNHVSNGGVVTTAPLSQPTAPSVAFGQPVAPATWPGARDAASPPYGVLSPGPVAASVVKRRKTTGLVLVLVGGLPMALGTQFPWESVSVPSFTLGRSPP